MTYTPFKMKGNPMQRNFGVGSPVKQTVAVSKEVVKASHQVGKKVIGKALNKALWPIEIATAIYKAATDPSDDPAIEKVGKAAWDVTGGFVTDVLDLLQKGGKPKNFPYPWDLRYSKGRLIQAPGTEIRRSTLTDE